MVRLPRVSVVIANWNRKKLLVRCIKSVLEQKYPGEIEIYVIDNQSTDGSIEAVNLLFPEVILIVTDKDRGACDAINRGCRCASGKYVLILDNDARLICTDILKLAVERLESYPTVDIAGKHYLIDAIAGHIIGPSNPPCEDDEHVHYNWAFCGAGILVNRKVGDSVGWYDPDFFIYANEMDLGAKLERIGVAIEHQPEFMIWHDHSPENRPRPRNTYYHARNLYAVYIRHLPLWLALYYSATNLFWVCRMPADCILPAIAAFLSAVSQLPKFVYQRDPIKNEWMVEAFVRFKEGIPIVLDKKWDQVKFPTEKSETTQTS